LGFKKYVHFRLYNYFIKSGTSENAIESFITKVSTTEFSPEQTIELVDQLHEISKSESISLDQVSGYIKEKLEEKQKMSYLRNYDVTIDNNNILTVIY
jgi:Na+-transporting NADH:ubiquinone oxidoreductase subunit NqrC